MTISQFFIDVRASDAEAVELIRYLAYLRMVKTLSLAHKERK